LAEGCTILAGRPKVGKSWLMLEIGLAVAGGLSCFNQVRCDEGDVLYLALEDNERRLQSRITKVLGVSAEWSKRFHYATEWPRADSGGLRYIREWIAAAEKPSLVVVDVLAMFRSPRGVKQSPYEDDYEAVRGLQQIASETGVAIVVVHHLRKSAADHDPFDKVSGTLGLSGAADTVLVLDRNSNGTTLYGRGRDVEEIEAAVQFDRETCRWSVLGEAAEVRRTEERSTIIAVLREGGKAMSPTEIAAATGMPNLNVRQLLFKLVKAGDVVKGGYGCYRCAGEPISPDNSDNTDNTLDDD
jgi:RecA-family ATPase